MSAGFDLAPACAHGHGVACTTGAAEADGAAVVEKTTAAVLAGAADAEKTEKAVALAAWHGAAGDVEKPK